jgi:hypothetical protein
MAGVPDAVQEAVQDASEARAVRLFRRANGSSASLQFVVVRSFVRLCASSESGAVVFVANAIFERVVRGENHHHSGSAEAQRL